MKQRSGGFKDGDPLGGPGIRGEIPIGGDRVRSNALYAIFQ